MRPASGVVFLKLLRTLHLEGLLLAEPFHD